MTQRRRAPIGVLLGLLLLLCATDLAAPERVDARPKITVTEYVTDLQYPWDLAFTPDGTVLFTEREGKLKARLKDGTVQTITADMSDLDSSGHWQRGLMSILVDRSFSANRRFYTCQTHTQGVHVIAWTINNDYTEATRVADPLVGGIPGDGKHVGCRLLFGPSGYLWISTGDAVIGAAPQNKDSLGGKVLRVDAMTGEGAPGNPFFSPDVEGSPLVYTYGHRNVQGLALRPGTRQMWATEHGPFSHDEINLLQAGRNYGWDPGGPEPDYYDESSPMTDLTKFPDAVRPKWTTGESLEGLIAPSGAVFLRGSGWGAWRGRLAVAALGSMRLYIFHFTSAGSYISHLPVPELDKYNRLRTPVMGPDGALYVTTSNGNYGDYILRVTATNPTTTTGGGGGGFGGGGPVGNQPPRFSEQADAVTRSVPENSPAGTKVGDPVAATDPDGDQVRYRFIGDDREMFDFDADTGQITVGEGTVLDYEGERNTYRVRVVALDVAGSGQSTEVFVTISVADVKLPGKADDYDANGDERLELAEVLAAVRDYFDGVLTQEEVRAVVRLYFSG